MTSNLLNSYSHYTNVINYFGEKVIERRIAQFMEEMNAFIEENDLTDIAYVNDVALTHAVMDYFSDIRRQKEYQHIEHVSETRIKAYETFWLLQRKPIQIKKQLPDDTWLYINEKFQLLRLTSFLLSDKLTVPLVGERRTTFENFMNSLYYHMKFRNVDAQSLELTLMAFISGQFFYKKQPTQDY